MINKRYLLLTLILFLVISCRQEQTDHDIIYLDKLQVEEHLPFRSFEDLSDYLDYKKYQKPASIDTFKIWQMKDEPDFVFTSIKENAIGPLVRIRYSTPDLIFSWKCDNSEIHFFVNFEAFDSRLVYEDLELSRQTSLTDLREKFPSSYKLSRKNYPLRDGVNLGLKIYPENGWLSIEANEDGISRILYYIDNPNNWVNGITDCNLPAL